MTIPFSNAIEVVSHFDHILCDIWGVVNGGGKPIEGSLEFLNQVVKMGKNLIFLSNVPRRSARVVDLLSSLGVLNVPENQVATSGEFFYQVMSGNYTSDTLPDSYERIRNRGKKCFAIGYLDDVKMISDLGFTLADAQEADWVALFGISGHNRSLDSVMHDLQICATRELPAVCINPDITTIVNTRQLIFCAGEIARRYQELGGQVCYFGKPYEVIYNWALKDLDILDKSKILAIGDSIDTDVKGALSFGVVALLVMTGVHADQYDFVNIAVKKLQDDNMNTPIFVCESLS